MLVEKDLGEWNRTGTVVRDAETQQSEAAGRSLALEAGSEEKQTSRHGTPVVSFRREGKGIDQNARAWPLRQGSPALVNESGVRVRLTNLGASVISIEVPDRDGELLDVVLGFDSPEAYADNPFYFGCTVGRVANRIRGGSFALDGKEYQLTKNIGSDALHGGVRGFHQMLWEAEVLAAGEEPSVRFSYLSPDGEEGYPGNLTISVTYTLRRENALQIDYEMTTDHATPVNLTNHSYFNLSGRPETTVLDHLLIVNADTYTPVDTSQIPTGEIASVEGTPLDFRTPTRIGDRIGERFDQLVLGHGYDLNWVLNRPWQGGLRLAAELTERTSGRVVECFTTEPGVQVYSGNSLDGSVTGKGGLAYQKHAGICLETQHFPNSPNIEHFPNTILRPGEVRRSRTVYRFSVE
jgi:aldose 1-epimerase